MNDQQIIEKLQEIVRNVLGYEDIVITKRTKMEDLGISSFSMVQIICAIEDEFEIEIPNMVIKSFNNVSAAVRHIKKEMKAKK